MSKYKMVRLGDIFDLQMGKTPSRNKLEYWNNGTNKWISIADIGLADKYIYETKELISNDAIQDSGIKIVPKDTVIMSFKLSIGKTCIVPEPMYTNEAVMAFINKGTFEIDNGYIYYLFKGKDWSEGTNKAVMGATLNKATLSNIMIPLFPLETQKQISKTLDKASEIINLNKKRLEEFDNLIKSVFYDMFGDPLELLESNNMNLLRKLCNRVVVGYVGEAKTEYVEKGIPYLRTQNVRRMNVDLKNLIYINRMFHEKLKKSKINAGDVALSRVGVNRGMAAVIPEDLGEANIANAIIIGKSNKVNSYYLAYYLNLTFGKHPSFGYSVGSAQGVVNTETVKNWPVLNADILLQNQFEKIVINIKMQQELVQSSLEKAQNLFNSLMSRYFD